jgi:hypothetical protein
MQNPAICKPENFYTESFQFTCATFIMTLNFLFCMNFSIYGESLRYIEKI